jgi:branched-subunit amino acid transport protein
MEAALKLWAVIFAKRSIPPLLARALKYVPAAMLTALVLPMVADVGPTGAISWSAPKVAAAILAAVVAWFVKSSPKTLVVGMLALWLLQWLLP